ncbi:pantoate--beta-alanine ligase [Psychroflexus tropicus]|uniref:pantoate--beta-alanine ligase n=1 Tax=Psychroflexus tropicus TaxID=197345 RepID=UPI00036F700E|nr:pantoate--beta-alanine ligase [Psychroflexus tropicus]
MVIDSKLSLQQRLDEFRKEGKTIGLVPTMGALHDGHLSLIDFAYSYCDKVVVSIFVNPTQFNNASDLEKYPRDIEGDAKFLTNHQPETIIFTPEVSEIYNDKVESESFEFGSIIQYMEGEFRTGHFDGVGSVLKRLFTITKPDKAFFGEKDFQQLQVVKSLVNITGQDVEIIGCPTSRNEFGLAQSSRNFRLTKQELKEAELIHEALSKAKNMFASNSIENIENQVKTMFQEHASFDLEYFSIAKVSDLIPTKTKESGQKYRAFIAAYLGEVRLIDNIAIN